MSRFPQIFEIHNPGQATEAVNGIPWEAALAKADQHSRNLLEELRKRLDASNGAARLDMTPVGPKLSLDPAWAMDNGEASVDIVALTYTTGADAMRRYLMPAAGDSK